MATKNGRPQPEVKIPVAKAPTPTKVSGARPICPVQPVSTTTESAVSVPMTPNASTVDQ
jgi:hypothetical protein